MHLLTVRTQIVLFPLNQSKITILDENIANSWFKLFSQLVFLNFTHSISRKLIDKK
jgi:hypothetical protein